MEEFGADRFLKREHELHDTDLGRASWGQVRSDRRQPVVDESKTRRGPYETSYEVTLGYDENSRI